MCLRPFDIGSDAIFRAMGRAESWTWHLFTLMLAWLLFLSWHGSGHLGRELVQLLLIPLLSTSGLQNNFTPYLGWVFLPQAFYHQWGTVHLSFPQTQTSSECFPSFLNPVLMHTENCYISYVFRHEKFAQAGFIRSLAWTAILTPLSSQIRSSPRYIIGRSQYRSWHEVSHACVQDLPLT